MLLIYRHQAILDMLSDKGMVRTSELMKLFETSFETIRKDLLYLEKKGYLTRVHGGAVPITAVSGDFALNLPMPESFLKRHSNHLEQKRSIARAACGYVKEGMCIAIDTGTTSYELSLMLMKQFEHLVIVTNSMLNAMVLSHKKTFNVIVTGGIISSGEQALVSDLALLLLDHVNIDIMFLTTCGISPETGVAEQSLEEIKVHKKMAEQASHLMILADSSKFSKKAFFHIYGLDEIECIITDEGLPDSEWEIYRSRGVEVRRTKE